MKLIKNNIKVFVVIFLGGLISLFFVNATNNISNTSKIVRRATTTCAANTSYPVLPNDVKLLSIDTCSQFLYSCSEGAFSFKINDEVQSGCSQSQSGNSRLYRCNVTDWNASSAVQGPMVKVARISCGNRSKSFLLSSKTSLMAEANWLNSLSVNVRGDNNTAHTTIAMSSDKLLINPYFANLAAASLAVADYQRFKSTIDGQINWYLNHLTQTGDDIYVYDYDIINQNVERITDRVDSVDSYHATFISLLALKAANDVNGFNDLFHNKSNIKKLKQIFRSLNSLKVSGQNYFIAKKSYPMSFTMDNSEVYKGLSEFCNIKQVAKVSILITKKLLRRELKWSCEISSAILSSFDRNYFVTEGDYYRVAVGEAGGFGSIYPEITANLWPSISHIQTAKSNSQWDKFKTQTNIFNNWKNDNLIGESFPHVALVRVAVKQGDIQVANDFISSVYQKRIVNQQRRWPWYAGESASLILSLAGK